MTEEQAREILRKIGMSCGYEGMDMQCINKTAALLFWHSDENGITQYSNIWEKNDFSGLSFVVKYEMSRNCLENTYLKYLNTLLEACKTHELSIDMIYQPSKKYVQRQIIAMKGDCLENILVRCDLKTT